MSYPDANPSTTWALRVFRNMALDWPDDFSDRYLWPEHNLAEMEALWDEVIAKIPVTATKVLDLGCGGGGFAQRLLAARPGIKIHGVDLVPENITTCEGLGLGSDVTWEVGNALEVLKDGGDWDYTVSIGCLFVYTDRRILADTFKLLDAASPKGFFVVTSAAHLADDLLTSHMDEVIAASANVTESYVTGTRDFLDASVVKGLRPFYLVREGTSTAAPEVRKKYGLVATGNYTKHLAAHEVRYKERLGQGRPDNVSIPEIDHKGRITGFVSRATDDVLGG